MPQAGRTENWNSTNPVMLIDTTIEINGRSSLCSLISQKVTYCKSHDLFRWFSCLFTCDTGLRKGDGMWVWFFSSYCHVLLSHQPAHSTQHHCRLIISMIPHPMNLNVLCAARRLCARPGRAPKFRYDGTPRYQSHPIWTYHRDVFYSTLNPNVLLIFSDRLLTISYAMYSVPSKVALNYIG